MIKSYNNDSDEGYFLEVEVQYPEDLRNLDLRFLPETMKIEEIFFLINNLTSRVGKIEEILANLLDKEEYVIYIINFKKAFNPQLISKKVNRVIKFDPKAWLNHILIKT